MRALALVAALSVCAACAGAFAGGTVRLHQDAPQVLVLSDDAFEVAVDVSRGGAITYLAAFDAGGTSGNLVDNGDLTGRSVQASLYDGHWGPDVWPCPGTAQAAWGYNPVQAGNACQQLSGGQLVSRTPTSIVTATTPRQWNSGMGISKIALQQTLTLQAPGVLRIDYAVTNHEAFAIGRDNWHELPVAYLTARLTLGTTSTGQQTRTSRLGFRDGSTWTALSDTAGWTVALVAPGDHLWSIGFGGDEKPTSWLQAWQWLELAPEQQGAATAWLVVGHSLDQVRQRLEARR